MCFRGRIRLVANDRNPVDFYIVSVDPVGRKELPHP